MNQENIAYYCIIHAIHNQASCMEVNILKRKITEIEYGLGGLSNFCNPKVQYSKRRETSIKIGILHHIVCSVI